VKNLCGKCNICCLVCRIDKSEFTWRDTDKEAGEWCDKLVNNRCVKYKSRPKACRNFECLWLQILKSPKKELALSKWRPDNLGIIVKTTSYNNKILFRVEEAEEGKIDFNNDDFLSFVDMLFQIASQQKVKTSIILFYFGEEKGHELKQNN
jgi:hypothetical protein